jgi:hypothetical protein
VRSFVKNAGLGFAIPCFYLGQEHDYLPDFIIRLELPRESFVILECKGFPDEHKDDKAAGAKRWVRAVNEDGRYGLWDYELAEHPSRVNDAIMRTASRLSIAAIQAEMVAYLATQLGPRWAGVGRRLARHLPSALNHEINFAEFESLADSFQCSLTDLHTAVEALSHPDDGFIERSFVRGHWPNRTVLKPEEVVAHARGFYLDKTLPPDKWSAWAKDVEVVWKLKKLETEHARCL